jgi:hypothetical protein
LKREGALHDLSRDHHDALFRAMRMKRASESDLEQVSADMLEFWSDHGATHFRIEEEVLLLAFAAHGDPEHPRALPTDRAASPTTHWRRLRERIAAAERA